jgi:hypothetical protein
MQFRRRLLGLVARLTPFTIASAPGGRTAGRRHAYAYAYAYARCVRPVPRRSGPRDRW